MNRKRRKEISGIIEEIEGIQSMLDALMKDEQDALDNLPESIQESERGERMNEIVDLIQSAIDNTQEAVEDLQEAIE